MRHFTTLALLLAALALGAAACDSKPPEAPAADKMDGDKKADDKMAADKKDADKKDGDKKDGDKMAGDKMDGAADKKMDGAADKKMDDKAPAAAGGADAAGDLKPGQNSDDFLKGIDGEGKGEKLMTLIETDKGNVECELFYKQTPETVKNFVGLARGLKAFQDPKTQQFVKRPFYDGIAFHRVIPKFMIQVGDPNGIGNYKPGYSFGDEIVPELRHTKGGLLSMANAGPATNGSQFFITEVATPWLDGKHAIFGECTPESVKVVESIARVPTGPGNKPSEPVTIKKVSFRYTP